MLQTEDRVYDVPFCSAWLWGQNELYVAYGGCGDVSKSIYVSASDISQVFLKLPGHRSSLYKAAHD